MPTSEQKRQGYEAPRNATIRTVLPSPADLPAREPGIAVMHTSHGVPFVRTADQRFNDLLGYAFAPNYVEIDGLRMHYVDEGPRTGQTVLLLRGQPHTSLEAGHYIQDNKGEELASLLLDFIARNPISGSPIPRIPRP